MLQRISGCLLKDRQLYPFRNCSQLLLQSSIIMQKEFLNFLLNVFHAKHQCHRKNTLATVSLLRSTITHLLSCFSFLVKLQPVLPQFVHHSFIQIHLIFEPQACVFQSVRHSLPFLRKVKGYKMSPTLIVHLQSEKAHAATIASSGVEEGKSGKQTCEAELIDPSGSVLFLVLQF